MQQGSDTITCDVEAQIRYVVRGEKATFYAGDRDRSYWPGEDHTVTIHDIRGEKDHLAFDRNGFVVLDEPTPVADYDDPDQLDTYCRYCEATVQRLTRASKVVSFGAIRRTNATGTHGHNQPANGAHVDYGAKTVGDYTGRSCLPKRRRSDWPSGTCCSTFGDRSPRWKARPLLCVMPAR